MLTYQDQLLRLARRRDFPIDAAELEAMFRTLHTEVVRLVAHIKTHWHDTQSRRELRRAFDTRAECFGRLFAASPSVAMRLAAEFNLVIPEVGHATMVG